MFLFFYGSHATIRTDVPIEGKGHKMKESIEGGNEMLQVQDRGSKKWVSLMLPEHIEMLREVFIEKQERPILDEQKMMEIDQTLKYALANHLEVGMTYFKDGNLLRLTGTLAKVDQWQGVIVLLNENGSHIPLKDITDAELIIHS